MKTILKTFYALILFSVHFGNANAQCADCFLEAVVADMAFSTSSGVQNTGIDNMEAGGVTYELSTWDGGTPGCGYFVDDGITPTSGDFGLYFSDAVDPDVSLVIGNNCSGTVIFGVIVYYSSTATGFVAELGSFATSWPYAYTYINNVVFALNSNQYYYNTTINIDRNERDNLIIAWDGGGDNAYYITGYVDCNTADVLVLNGCGPTHLNNAATLGRSPDVTLYYNNNTTDQRAVFTFIEPSSGDLMVQDEDYADLVNCSNQASPSLLASVTGGYTFEYPRIAAANGALLWNTPWTVVVAEYSGSDYFIRGYSNTYNGGSPTVVAHTYNDGSADSPADITLVPNQKTVVAYSDDLVDGMAVGWTFDNTGDPQSYSGIDAEDARYPVVLGQMSTEGYFTPGVYWEVPDPVTNTPDDYSTLSMAYVYNLSFIYYDALSSTPYVKRVAANASNLRTPKYSGSPSNLFPNPNNGQFEITNPFPTNETDIEVVNMFGEKVYQEKLTAAKQTVNLADMPTGIYLLRFQNHQQSITEKLFISR